MDPIKGVAHKYPCQDATCPQFLCSNERMRAASAAMPSEVAALRSRVLELEKENALFKSVIGAQTRKLTEKNETTALAMDRMRGAEAELAAMKNAPPIKHNRSLFSKCGHNSYWIGHYGTCMVCRAEQAESALRDKEAQIELERGTCGEYHVRRELHEALQSELEKIKRGPEDEKVLEALKWMDEFPEQFIQSHASWFAQGKVLAAAVRSLTLERDEARRERDEWAAKARSRA